MEERWKPLPGFEDNYLISEQGRVKSRRRRGTSGDVVAHYIHDGYHYVKLWRNNQETRLRVHRLVLLAFVGEPPADRPHGLHNDGNKDNNALTNLRWGNDSENTLDRVKHGNHNNARKTECKRGHPFTPENTHVYASGARRCKACRRKPSEV